MTSFNANCHELLSYFLFYNIQGADDKLGQVSRRSLMDVTLCER